MANKSKQKGNRFEYDVQHSLRILFPGISRTAERGYQRQYDLHHESVTGVCSIFECKRMSLSWNELYKIFHKLRTIAIHIEKEGKTCHPYLIFKANRQPCLAMFVERGYVTVREFDDFFGVPFDKHPSTRLRTSRRDVVRSEPPHPSTRAKKTEEG